MDPVLEAIRKALWQTSRHPEDEWTEMARAAISAIEATVLIPKWRPISEAPRCDCCPPDEAWISRQLFAIKRPWGWEMWVGQCDAGYIWLGRKDDGSCFETDAPTHFMPLPAPPGTAAPPRPVEE